MQRSALCRSRRELSNEYLLAKIGVDTAENEPCKVCPLSAYRSPRFPQDIQSIMFIDVSNDTCIAEEEQCREDYSNIGFVGVMSACVAIGLVVLSCGMDVHHDYLMRQL